MSCEVAMEMQGGRWKRYPAYKDSGVEWIGEIPEGWPSTAVKHHFDIQLGKMLQNKPDSDELLVPYAKALHVFWGKVETNALPKMWANTFEIQQYGIKDGDLLVCEGGEVGRAGIVKSPPKQCIIQNALHRVRAKNSSDLRYLFYLLHAVNSSTWFDVLCNKATIAHFTREKFSDLNIPAPTLPEQHAIAAFLDRETGRIDTLIEKKVRQVELLQEKRAALISHAVTKGLDPDVKMKDSGVEWLGQVPEGWKLRKLKHFAKINLSNVDKKAKEDEDSVKLCNYVDVYKNDCITSDLNFMEATASPNQIDKFALREGDVLITKDSESWEDIAVPAYIPTDLEDVICGYHLAHIRPNHVVVNGEYIFRSFSAICLNYQFKVEANGITRFGIGKYPIDNSLFLVPPINEQKSIATFLDRETARIDTLTTKIRESISKYREYRTALISAAVTGKIDVRSEET